MPADIGHSPTLLAGAVRLYQADSVLSAFEASMEVGAALVPANLTSISVVDIQTGSLAALLDRAVPIFPELATAWERNASEHPLVQHAASTGDLGVHAISELMPLREFHRTALYREFFAHIDAFDQASIPIHISGTTAMALALNFTRKITDRELALLRALQPHLTRVVQTTEALEDTNRSKNAVGIAIADQRGHLVYVSPRARRLLLQANESPVQGKLVPADFGQWATRAGMAGGGDTIAWPGLRARVLDRPAVGGGVLLGLSGTGENVRTKDLAILRLVADGLTDVEISARLALAPRTVGTYLERMFDRYGLRNRAAAAAWYVRTWEQHDG